ncbi:universal stress protein [Paucihalobacter sp.]|uniref:universal stress protein n=1 Tax=Paucihalobacter sp. TaxID=2850405 RepID=UPI002FE3D586
MITNILIPTDFSRNAWQAVQYALVLFKNHHCNIHLVNAFEFSDGMSFFVNPEPGDEEYETAKSEAEDNLAKALDMMALKPVNQKMHNVTCEAICGEPLKVIKDYVSKHPIDLLIMGTQGTSNTSEAVYGSVAVNVMEKMRECPVIVIPLAAEIQQPAEIVFPSKFKSQFSDDNLSVLKFLSKRCNAEIKVLHIFKDGDSKLSEDQIKIKTNLLDLLNDCKISYKQLHHQEVLNGINCFTESRESDMLCFLNKKHAFFGSILSRPLVNQITFYTHVPILVLHE